jgi:putative Holliday junction resolvase
VTLRGTLIGFDFGERRIGIAVGETSVGIANPVGHIEAASNDARFEAIARVVAEWQPAGFVVGRPRHADDSPHDVARLAEKFGRRLAARFQLPVVFVDETLTSATAEAELRGVRTRAGKRGDIDALAASLILQSYLDAPGDHGEQAA